MSEGTSKQQLLSPSEREALQAIGVVRVYEIGERLVQMGARSQEVFYLLSGVVKIGVVASNGTESVFGRRRPGEFIGEMSALTSERRNADVVAVTATEAIMVTAPRFVAFLEANPKVAIAMLRMQARRLDEMTIRNALGTRSVKARVAQRLLDLSETSASNVVVDITQGELGKYIDASREWTSKALGELRRAGVIDTSRGKVIILRRDALIDASHD